MTRVLLTAFQPYENWATNASWLALVELTRDLPPHLDVTTRLYPVDYDGLLDRLTGDLYDHYDYAILTGQAPGRARIEFETVALNLASDGPSGNGSERQLIADAPLAYSSRIQAEPLCHTVRAAGIPAAVSYHAGTYLCNAALFLALHQIATEQLKTESIFVHMPIDASQAATCSDPIPSLPASMSAQALRIILLSLTGNDAPQDDTWT